MLIKYSRGFCSTKGTSIYILLTGVVLRTDRPSSSKRGGSAVVVGNQNLSESLRSGSVSSTRNSVRDSSSPASSTVSHQNRHHHHALGGLSGSSNTTNNGENSSKRSSVHLVPSGNSYSSEEILLQAASDLQGIEGEKVVGH